MKPKFKPSSYWKQTECSDLLFELYMRAFRHNPHMFEIVRNRFDRKCYFVLKVNLFFTKDPNLQKMVMWHTSEFYNMTDLMNSFLWVDYE